jgi:hypothetical protein
MGKEEQVEEKEVLKSIFLDEIISMYQFTSNVGSVRIKGPISAYYSL